MKRLFVLVLCICLLCPSVQAASSQKLVALTFDDGPSGRFTRRLLQGLEERNVKATFLLCGYRMALYPALTQRIHREGHEIGLHGYSHKAMSQMSEQEIRDELTRSIALLPKDCTVSFLRPPGGQCSSAIRSVSKSMKLPLLCWSVDPRDWEINDTTVITRRVVSQARDGDVILLHDMSDSSVDAALAIIDALQDQGFQFVTVSEMVKDKGACPQPGKIYCRFG